MKTRLLILLVLSPNYNVVIYGDAQTTLNGGPTQTNFDNPLVRLVYQ